MPKYSLDLENVMDEIFYALECCNEGVHSHEVLIEADNPLEAGSIVANQLKGFLADNFEEEEK